MAKCVCVCVLNTCRNCTIMRTAAHVLPPEQLYSSSHSSVSWDGMYRAHGWSLSGSSHMFSALIKSDKHYYVYSMCLTLRQSYAHPHWEALCYSLKHLDANHVCGNTEFILSFAFLLFFEFGETCVWGKASTSANLTSGVRRERAKAQWVQRLRKGHSEIKLNSLNIVHFKLTLVEL